jgi:hypothetical protein
MFNSFGFITIMVFVFALLTTIVFPPTDADQKLAAARAMARVRAIAPAESPKTVKVSKYDDAGGLVRSARARRSAESIY